MHAVPVGPLAALLVTGVMVGLFDTAEAKILKTRGAGPPAGELMLTIGSGFEYETDPEESEMGFPFLVEYGFTEKLQLSVEPSYVVIRSKPGERGDNVRGMGDLETTVEYELVSERRNRPAFSLEGVVKWPTAANLEIGTKQRDYSLGLIMGKEFVRFDLEFNGVYTFIGSPAGEKLQNEVEYSIASEWHLNHALDLEAEIVTSTGAGGFRGRTGTIGGFGGGASIKAEKATEGTLGLAVYLNDFLKLEQGAIIKSDGSWQAVFAWEWDFSGGR